MWGAAGTEEEHFNHTDNATWIFVFFSCRLLFAYKKQVEYNSTLLKVPQQTAMATCDKSTVYLLHGCWAQQQNSTAFLAKEQFQSNWYQVLCEKSEVFVLNFQSIIFYSTILLKGR